MSIADDAFRAITGRSPVRAPKTVRGQISELKRQHGSRRAAARALGVSESTLRRLESGETRATAASAKAVAAAERRTRLPRDTEARFRSAGNAMTITAETRVSSDVRVRTLELGRFADPDAGAQLIDAYLSGDRDELERTVQGIAEDYYGGLEILDVREIRIL